MPARISYVTVDDVTATDIEISVTADKAWLKLAGVSFWPANANDATVVEQLELIGSIGYAIAAKCERLAEERASRPDPEREVDAMVLDSMRQDDDEPGLTADEVDASPFMNRVAAFADAAGWTLPDVPPLTTYTVTPADEQADTNEAAAQERHEQEAAA